jgi:hypothetical protein
MSKDNNYIGSRVKEREDHMAATEFKPLQFPFIKSGFTHELIARDGLVCLVRRSRVGFSDMPAHFEVVRLRQYDAWTAPTGEIVPPTESYPASENWGLHGFTYRDESSAREKYRKMLRTCCQASVSKTADRLYAPATKRGPSSGMYAARHQFELALEGGVR